MRIASLVALLATGCTTTLPASEHLMFNPEYGRDSTGTGIARVTLSAARQTGVSRTREALDAHARDRGTEADIGYNLSGTGVAFSRELTRLPRLHTGLQIGTFVMGLDATLRVSDDLFVTGQVAFPENALVVLQQPTRLGSDRFWMAPGVFARRDVYGYDEPACDAFCLPDPFDPDAFVSTATYGGRLSFFLEDDRGSVLRIVVEAGVSPQIDGVRLRFIVGSTARK